MNQAILPDLDQEVSRKPDPAAIENFDLLSIGHGSSLLGYSMMENWAAISVFATLT